MGFTEIKEEFFTRRIDRNSDGLPLGEDSGIPQERHAKRELMLVLSGDTEFTLNGKRFRATPGTAFFVDSWTAHKQDYGSSDVSCKHYWIHLHEKRIFGGLLELDATGKHFFTEMTQFLPEIEPIVLRRWQLLERDDLSVEQRKLLQSSILRIILDDLALQQFHIPAVKPPHEIVAAVCQYIIMNHGRNFARLELEKFSGYTTHHLMRIFKEQTRLTMGEYINQVRRGYVSVATGRGLSQKEIAGQLGFASPSAFWLWKHRDRRRQLAASRKP